MDSTMEGMLDTYLFETDGMLDKLDEMLVADEKAGDMSQDDINEIFRIMHTIKGSSAMMEFTPVAEVAHKIEDLFFYIRDKGSDAVAPQDKKDLFDLMFRCEDHLRGEVDKIRNGEKPDENIADFSKEITDFLARLSRDSGAAGDSAAAAPAASSAPAAKAPAPAQNEQPDTAAQPNDPKAAAFLHIFLEEGIGMENLRAFMIVTALRECDLAFRCYPPDLDTNADTASQVVENGFYLAFDTEEEANKAASVLKSQNHIRSFELEKPNVKAPETPAPAAANQAASPASAPAKPAAAAPAHPAAPATPVKQSLISVSLEKLDALMNIVGEIVITESMVTSSPVLKELSSDSFDTFNKSGRQLRKLTDDLQDISMSLRMVPVSGVFQKMNRIVRDMKKKLNKDVRLTIVGEDTEVDKTIVDAIQDPIMHIVRNSMDHGIENTREERIAVGKDPQGEIILSASHTSSEVVISISDDGYGMDPEKLLDKAQQKNLLTKPRASYSKRDALNLILLPGFSTNTAVTEYSGRGVGMDVVKRNVEQVGGVVNIDSEIGKGTTVTLKIPLTLAIVDGMKITVGSSIFTIPIVNIKQSFKVKAEDIILDENGNEMVDRMGDFYPVVRLDRFYGIPSEFTNIEDSIMIWVEAGDKSCCLLADHLIGEQQVVVKPLPVYFNSFQLKDMGISGCTILGDGNISIILDVGRIYASAIESSSMY
jgi:two-component system chemotaxis sensor kinase CheA